ncbi:hypothetical protein, partial [Kingella kingae]
MHRTIDARRNFLNMCWAGIVYA